MYNTVLCSGSINGENIHYGTPRNPCAEDRVPGGSSSGSAVAVGAKLVDFSLGQQFIHFISCFEHHSVNNQKYYVFPLNVGDSSPPWD